VVENGILTETEQYKNINPSSEPTIVRWAYSVVKFGMAHERIERDPAVMMGKPVIKGTRITVELILRECARGATLNEIVEDYPSLNGEDIHAALAYAADYLSHEGILAAE
jgi:uncharacterized protein (DUF433 family)